MKIDAMHVLIIGIDKYDSTQLSSLQGCRNDAIAWYRFCVAHLGVQPENIAVLASPKLTPRDLGPEAEKSRLRGATRAEITDEAKKLATAAASGAGLVTYSGHGLALAHGASSSPTADLALCPSDVSLDPGKGIDSVVRFTELAEIFRAQDGCSDNITVFLDTCYATGPAAVGRVALGKGGATAPVDAFGVARRCHAPHLFTSRLLLGARHWTQSYEIQVGGQWRGAASFALQTLMERWALREEGGVRYPDVSHADLVDRMGDMLGVLGVPQSPALWGARRLDEVPVLRPGLHVVPGDTSAEPDAPKRLRQVPVNPDHAMLLQFTDVNGNAVIRVVVIGDNLPRGWTGLTTRTEYWYTNTTSPPALSGLTMSVTSTTEQRVVNDFIGGYTLAISCGQLEGVANWAAWSSTVNTTGTLLQTPDPTGKDAYMAIYFEYNSSGVMTKTAWYRISLLDGGFAYKLDSPPQTFTAIRGTDPNSIQTASWSYSTLLPPGQ